MIVPQVVTPHPETFRALREAIAATGANAHIGEVFNTNALLAEALDVLHASGDDPRAAAEALGCSSSQLIKLLKEQPRALSQVNGRRRQAGRHPLH